MTSGDTSESANDPATEEAPKTMTQRIVHEVRETALTIAVFLPFWLVFSTFIYELRSIPSESMVPALQVGDRVAVAKFAYGYDRNSVPFGMGRWFLGDDPEDPNELWLQRSPRRGDVIVFQHPRSSRVMIKRLIALPGDTVQIREGQLWLNGERVNREEVRTATYYEAGPNRFLRQAREYREQLPGEEGSHLIHEFGDAENLDQTPVFRVPDGHFFAMGDNRDNSLDSRAPSGHLGIAALMPEAWGLAPPIDIKNGDIPSMIDQAIGFVPMDHLIGRAETVLFSLNVCRNQEGAECPKRRLWAPL
jgi:signal peptidase I